MEKEKLNKINNSLCTKIVRRRNERVTTPTAEYPETPK